jgi:hypothetical protein
MAIDKNGAATKKRSGVARYWPVAAVVIVAAAALGIGAALGGGDDDDPAGSTAASGDGAPALAAFEGEDPLDAPDCDPDTGRLAIPTLFAPNCVPLWPDDRDNGGATSPGVTEDEIIVARYVAQEDESATAITDEIVGEDAPTDEENAEYRAKVLEYYNALYETYGREVTLVDVDATGAADDDAAARADALNIAQDVGAFAVIGGPAQTNAFAETLAAEGVVCLCVNSQPQDVYEDLAPYAWGGLMSSTQGYVHRADYVANRLAGKPAEFAGDPALQSQDRTFAIVYYETADGSYGAGVDYFEEQLAEDGVELADRVPYVLDLSRAPEDAATIIARLKDAGITSVIFAGDPFFPIYLTQEATAQDYRPEWVITGSTLTDTAAFARRYDQEQWAHAFGISFLTARIDPAVSEEVETEYNPVAWYLGETLEAYPNLLDLGRLFIGIHLAGPELTPETYRDAMFAYDPVNGHTTTLSASYGTELWPWPDYAAADDITEIWWDTEATGPDETEAEGQGMYRYMSEGQRYMPGEVGESTAVPFDEAGTSLLFDGAPDGDVPPTYPRRASREG